MKHSLLHNFRSFFRVLDQHRFYTAVCVAGTAVTIAFIMVVVMVYDFRTANVAPETRQRWYTVHASRRYEHVGLPRTGTHCLPRFI